MKKTQIIREHTMEIQIQPLHGLDLVGNRMMQIIREVGATSLPVVAAQIRNIRGVPAALADDVVDYALAPAVAGVLACGFDFDDVV
jgi:hypothetical protein